MPDTRLREIFCEKLKRLFYHDVLDSLQMNSIVTAFDKACAESALNAEPPAVPSRESELETALRWAIPHLHGIRLLSAQRRWRCEFCGEISKQGRTEVEHEAECSFAAAKRLLGNTGRKAAPEDTR